MRPHLGRPRAHRPLERGATGRHATAESYHLGPNDFLGPALDVADTQLLLHLLLAKVERRSTRHRSALHWRDGALRELDVQLSEGAYVVDALGACILGTI